MFNRKLIFIIAVVVGVLVFLIRFFLEKTIY